MPRCPICGDTVPNVEEHLQKSILVGRGTKQYPSEREGEVYTDGTFEYRKVDMSTPTDRAILEMLVSEGVKRIVEANENSAKVNELLQKDYE